LLSTCSITNHQPAGVSLLLCRLFDLDLPASSRKTLIYLILTLNHIYPDYDFSQLRAHHFRKEAGLPRAEELIDTHLLEVSKVSSSGRLFVRGVFSLESKCAVTAGEAG
jgi:hypothetical protein